MMLESGKQAGGFHFINKRYLYNWFPGTIMTEAGATALPARVRQWDRGYVPSLSMAAGLSAIRAPEEALLIWVTAVGVHFVTRAPLFFLTRGDINGGSSHQRHGHIFKAIMLMIFP